MAERGDEDNVGVGGMQRDAADVAGVAQTDVIPGPSAVGRLVDAVAPRRALPVRRFAAAQPHDVGIRLEHRDGANRVDALAIEERLERHAVVRGLPQAAGRARDEERLGRRFDDREIDDAAAHGRGTDRAGATGRRADRTSRPERSRPDPTGAR